MGKKPNVIMILTDQQSCWTLSCYGGEVVQTPYADTLAAEGARLSNCMTVSAVCTPSRGCFMTGRYPHRHGAFDNKFPMNLDEMTFARVLKSANYDTGYIGKWHLAGADGPTWIPDEMSVGFDDHQYMFNRGHLKEFIDREGQPPARSAKIGNETTYATDWLADKACNFIRSERSNPFCLVVSIPDPHTPFNVRAPYDTMYKPEDMIVPESFNQEIIPDWAEERRQTNFPLDMPDREERLRIDLAQYCGEVKCIDDNVGKIMDCLKEKGIYDDTVIIFTSDHGEYLGEHGGLGRKNCLYETAHRIPMIIRWPERIQAGTLVDQVVTNVDFQPTLLNLIGVEPSGREDGRDASPLLQNKDIPWSNEAIIHPNNSLFHTGIFTDQYELAYGPDGFKDHVLFDRKKDPEQMKNLYNEPSYKDIISELTLRIAAHHDGINTPKERIPEPARKWMN